LRLAACGLRLACLLVRHALPTALPHAATCIACATLLYRCAHCAARCTARAGAATQVGPLPHRQVRRRRRKHGLRRLHAPRAHGNVGG
jgi:hypothetical protein